MARASAGVGRAGKGCGAGDRTSGDVSRETRASAPQAHAITLAHTVCEPRPTCRYRNRRKPVEDVLDIDPAGDLAEGAERQPDILGGKFERPVAVERSRRARRKHAPPRSAAMALAGDDRVSRARPSRRGAPAARSSERGHPSRRRSRPRRRRSDGIARRARSPLVPIAQDPCPARHRDPRGAVRSDKPEDEVGLLAPAPAPATRLPARPDRAVSRRPAVSTKVTGSPPRSQRTSMASRVVPGIGETMATSPLRDGVEEGRLAGVRRPREHDREALPQPLAAAASARWRASSSATAPAMPAWPCSRAPAGTSPSSEKSSAASSSARHSIKLAPASSRRGCRAAPSSWRRACRRCASVSASMRSARPSTAG